MSKIRLKGVREQQQGIRDEFERPDKSDPKAQPRLALTEEVWRDIEFTFKSQRELCNTLETTAKTWRDLKTQDEGVREGTAYRVLIEFISLLRKIAQGKIPPPSTIHDELVAGLESKYGQYLESRKFDELVVRVDSPDRDRC